MLNTDVLAVAKNIVLALNQLGQTYLSVMGAKRSQVIAPSTATLVVAGAGRLANVSVMGSSITSTGTIYDCSSSSSLANPLGIIETGQHIYQWNIPFINGLVIVPGSGMSVVVSYSGGT